MVRFVAINDYGNRFFMDNVNINGQNILAIEEGESNIFHTSIFPNPTKGMFNIRTDANKLEVEISNLMGEIVTTTIVRNGLQQINLANHAKGIYFVKLKSGKKTEQRKIIVQ